MILKPIAFSLLTTSYCYASTSQVIPMDAQKRIEASISKDNLNRLAILNDRITQVFGDEEAYVLQVDENSGQVFIKPSDLNGSKPISLTVTTENGQTQDLTLKPFDREASTVLLKGAAKEAKEGGTGKYEPVQPQPLLDKTVSVQEKLIQAMKMLVTHQLPASEKKEEESGGPRGPEGLEIKLQHVYQVGPYKGYTYEVKNTTETLFELDDKSFYRQGDLALSFQKRVLKPEETTLLWVISR